MVSIGPGVDDHASDSDGRLRPMDKTVVVDSGGWGKAFLIELQWKASYSQFIAAGYIRLPHHPRGEKKELNSSFKNSDYFFFVSSWGILHSISFQNERFIYFPR